MHYALIRMHTVFCDATLELKDKTQVHNGSLSMLNNLNRKYLYDVQQKID